MSPTQAKLGLNGPRYSFQGPICFLPHPEKPRVAHSSRVWLEWGHPVPLAQPDRCVSHPVHSVLNLHCKQIARDDKVGASDACRHCLAAKQIMFAARSDYLPFLLKEWFLCVSDAGAL